MEPDWYTELRLQFEDEEAARKIEKLQNIDQTS